MERSVLVDSCVFIGLLREGRNPGYELSRHAGDRDLLICGMIRLEVCRGIVQPAIRKRTEQFMNIMLNVRTDNRLWLEATELGWNLDRRGFTLPATDLLIASCAMRVWACVLSYDEYFRMIPGLEVVTRIEDL